MTAVDPKLLAEYDRAMAEEGIPEILAAVRRRQALADEARQRSMYPKEEPSVHYRNGREAKNGDKVVQLTDAQRVGVKITAIGILFDAVPGNDYCNGNIASTIGGPVVGACLCDCLHADDLAEILKEKGLDKRPAGK